MKSDCLEDMIRKVIQQGNETLTMTLPREWTGKYGVKGGDSLEVSARDNILEVTSRKSNKEGHVYLRLDREDWPYMRWMLGALFRRGVDEIRLGFDDDTTLTKVQEIITRKFQGYIITEQRKDGCVIKSISTDDPGNLRSLINRCFIILISFSENCHGLIKNREYKKLKDILYLHDNSDQTIALCERIIVKNTYNDVAYSSFSISILENLELVGDVYRDICNLMVKRERAIGNETKILGLLLSAHNLLRDIFSLQSEYRKEKITPIIQGLDALRSDVREMEKKSSGTDTLLLHHISSIQDLLKNFLPSVILLNVQSDEAGRKQ
jgi:hypothetical protein